MEYYQLKQRQALSLDQKIILSQRRIQDWYEHFNGQVYISFSGGKDSTVLLHLVRSLYPEVEAVFVDTGLEFPEIRDFVKTIDNVTWLKPKIPFTRVLTDYGYPVISKEVAQKIHEIRHSTKHIRNTRIYGDKNGNGKVAQRWLFLVDAPFEISEKCCNVMKKNPAKAFEKESGKVPFLGTMASESRLRSQKYLQVGCNAFEAKRPNSAPLSVWVEDDIWSYINKYHLGYSKIYNMGYDRTGCMFCMFGIDAEPQGNTRFDKMEKTHPKQYDYCMNKLGLRSVLDFIYPDKQHELF